MKCCIKIFSNGLTVTTLHILSKEYVEKNNDRRDINKAISAKMDNRARVILFGGEKTF